MRTGVSTRLGPGSCQEERLTKQVGLNKHYSHWPQCSVSGQCSIDHGQPPLHMKALIELRGAPPLQMRWESDFSETIPAKCHRTVWNRYILIYANRVSMSILRLILPIYSSLHASIFTRTRTNLIGSVHLACLVRSATCAKTRRADVSLLRIT